MWLLMAGTAMFEVSVGRWPVATTRKKYLWNCEYFSHLYDLLTDLMGSALISLLAYLNAVPLEVHSKTLSWDIYSVYYKDMLKNVDKFVASAINILNNADMLLGPDSFSRKLSIAC